MLHDRIRLSTGKHSIDVHVEDATHVNVVSTPYGDRVEPYSEPRGDIYEWYFSQSKRLFEEIETNWHYFTARPKRRSEDASRLAEWAIETAHGAHGLSVAFSANEGTAVLAERFEKLSQRAGRFLMNIYSYERYLRTIN